MRHFGSAGALPERITLDALVRPRMKTRQNQKMRDSGRIPGVLYGKDQNGRVLKQLISVETKALSREIRSRGVTLENTVFELNVMDEDGTETKHAVAPRQLTRNPLTDLPMSCNFLKYWSGARMRIPLNFINQDQSVALKRGCFLLRVNRFIECIVDDPESIPDYINVDVTGTEKNDVLRLEHVTFPPNVRPSNRVPDNFVAGVVKNK